MVVPAENPIPELAALGFRHHGPLYANLAAPLLVEQAVRRAEGILTDNGAIVAYTGKYTGRTPKDKYIVDEPTTHDQIAWGNVNQPLSPASFDRLLARMQTYAVEHELFVSEGSACADPALALPVRVIATQAWHGLFARNLLRRPVGNAEPALTILAMPEVKADPAVDGTRSDTFVVLHLARRIVLIGGTHYAGEIKKSVFSFLNYLLPQKNVLSMHCSANVGAAGDTALFFGLSGTGKTTLSADPSRRLIGDDEHGWSNDGVFNIEGGCYAKCIRLSREGEPQIWNAMRFGCVLENVVVDPVTRRPNFDDTHHTENTRAAYPVEFIDHALMSGRGGHPSQILFLACDAFGVLPPIGRLSPEQAMYHFLSGYTAKVAGTEAGVTEPQVTFSTCFAAPFLPLLPGRYAEMLRQRLVAHNCQVWLVNTGWTGGPPGVGSRFKLAYTRAMVEAILAGALNKAPMEADPIFGVSVPLACPGVPSEVLRPRNAWKDPAAYDAMASRLAGLFRENFKAFAGQMSDAVRQAEPRG